MAFNWIWFDCGYSSLWCGQFIEVKKKETTTRKTHKIYERNGEIESLVRFFLCAFVRQCVRSTIPYYEILLRFAKLNCASNFSFYAILLLSHVTFDFDKIKSRFRSTSNTLSFFLSIKMNVDLAQSMAYGFSKLINIKISDRFDSVSV